MSGEGIIHYSPPTPPPTKFLRNFNCPFLLIIFVSGFSIIGTVGLFIIRGFLFVFIYFFSFIFFCLFCFFFWNFFLEMVFVDLSFAFIYSYLAPKFWSASLKIFPLRGLFIIRLCKYRKIYKKINGLYSIIYNPFIYIH